jgi:AcrR family transcriptional regulator
MGLTRPPRQRRSQETLEKFLRAAQNLLEEKTFNEVSVNEIVERAGSSVGAFYVRFADKQALLECLRDAFTRETEEEARRLALTRDWASASLGTAVAEFIRVLVQQHRKHRGTLRALVGLSMTGGRSAAGHSDPIGFLAGGRGDVAAGTAGNVVSPFPLIDLIAKRRSEIDHPDPDVAAHLGLGIVMSAIRERVLFPELSVSSRPMAHVTDAVFAEELARVFLGFLGVNRPYRPG